MNDKPKASELQSTEPFSEHFFASIEKVATQAAVGFGAGSAFGLLSHASSSSSGLSIHTPDQQPRSEFM